MERLETKQVRVGDSLVIGGGAPIVVQTMCNTHTSDVDATVAQCLQLAAAGAQMVRVTVPGLQDVPSLREIRGRLDAEGCRVPLVADIHFSSDTAIACAQIVEKVRINPGNFHPDHDVARRKFAEFLEVCKAHGTAVSTTVRWAIISPNFMATLPWRWPRRRWSGWICASKLPFSMSLSR